MTPPTITLTERRTAVRHVPRADIADVARDFNHAVDVAPTACRGRYRLTARGHVGWFRTSTVTWVVRPKLPWADLARLAGAAEPLAGPESADLPAAFTALAASRLAALMLERSAAGLACGYIERPTLSTTVRGRIDFARHARQPSLPGTDVPIIADELGPDVPWNRVPLAAARRLLGCGGLPTALRVELTRAADAFAGVTSADATAIDLAAVATPAPHTAAYAPLLSWARVILGAGGLLLNLEHLFELHVTRRLEAARGTRWVEPQADLPLSGGPGMCGITLRPDVIVRRANGSPRSVWDVKWKRLTAACPEPTDTHQALAYAAALGVSETGLIYPARRFAADTFRAPSGIRLHIIRAPVAGEGSRRRVHDVRFCRYVLRAHRNPGG